MTLGDVFAWLVEPSYSRSMHRATKAADEVTERARALSDASERTVMRLHDDATVASMRALSTPPTGWDGRERRGRR